MVLETSIEQKLKEAYFPGLRAVSRYYLEDDTPWELKSDIAKINCRLCRNSGLQRCFMLNMLKDPYFLEYGPISFRA